MKIKDELNNVEWTLTRKQYARLKKLQRMNTYKRNKETWEILKSLPVEMENPNRCANFPDL